jgi:hypothetical protein
MAHIHTYIIMPSIDSHVWPYKLFMFQFWHPSLG